MYGVNTHIFIFSFKNIVGILVVLLTYLIHRANNNYLPISRALTHHLHSPYINIRGVVGKGRPNH